MGVQLPPPPKKKKKEGRTDILDVEVPPLRPSSSPVSLVTFCTDMELSFCALHAEPHSFFSHLFCGETGSSPSPEGRQQPLLMQRAQDFSEKVRGKKKHTHIHTHTKNTKNTHKNTQKHTHKKTHTHTKNTHTHKTHTHTHTSSSAPTSGAFKWRFPLGSVAAVAPDRSRVRVRWHGGSWWPDILARCLVRCRGWSRDAADLVTIFRLLLHLRCGPLYNF